MNKRRISKNEKDIHPDEPTQVASLISRFMRMARSALIHERDRLQSKLLDNGPPGGLMPKERQRLAAVCGALVGRRIARHVAAGMICIVATLMTLGAGLGLKGATAAQRGEADADGVQVLTSGPVHEAFAETVSFDPEPGLVAPKASPPAIEELPPEQRPEGVNVAWIPGYWAWDDERTDFLWVSGIWRSLPPGRQWVPGYWARSGQGAQWTSGYWADAKDSEIEYLPEPPTTVEVGPNVAAPSADYSWLPGCWIWHQNRYAWRPGFWAAGQSDWVWVPAHYVWTPRGYVFVEGYYDYSVVRRGVLFAPVYFNSSVYAQRGFSYSPTVVISSAMFASHLFLRPSYCHYYYGDYYGSNYVTAGYSPWFSFNSSRFGYDPFYAQQRWIHRQDQGWEQTVQTNYQNLRDHEEARPPRTWADQRARIANDGTPNGQNFVVATSLAELAKSKEQPLRFQPVDKTERQKFAQHQQGVHQLREQRQKLEVRAADSTAPKPKPSQETPPAKMKLPPSPIVALPADRLSKEHLPPQRHEAPKPDHKVEPKPRATGGQPAREGLPPVRKFEPRPEPPKAGPPAKPPRENKETPRAEPRPQPPKAGPPAKPPRENKEPPRAEPKPQPPKAEPPAKPPRENKEPPRGEPREKPRGDSNDKPKDKPKK